MNCKVGGIATYIFNFNLDFEVRDRQALSIYFPENGYDTERTNSFNKLNINYCDSCRTGIISAPYNILYTITQNTKSIEITMANIRNPVINIYIYIYIRLKMWTIPL